MKIEIKDKQILVDGKPELIMSGEIHYYRVQREDWEDRILKLKESGCNTVATYIPWICHNPIEGEMDLDGSTRPELDLGAFIDLCAKHDLMCFLRPGPFIMAEMKNEGIPSWIYAKHKEIIPVGWDGGKPTTPTLDYLAPNFLMEVKKWYEAVMTLIASRLCTRGGNVISVQLDNEIGMLSWVSNVPDLTDYVLSSFKEWLLKRYNKSELETRYPFSFDDFNVYSKAIRSPQESYSLELFKDLGYYMRHRFAIYIKTLRLYAEESGVKDIPFVVNIHGTGGGRGLTYPIGISQLYESYTQEEGYLYGSDIYLGDLTMDRFQDLYICNALMAAVGRDEQPLTSVEFECGDGNYGSNFSGRFDVSAADFKTRMCIAQGNRLLNYYLFAGGTNYRFDNITLNDGNNRIAITGERHGFAAPISPEGELNYTYPRMASTIKTMLANKSKLASMTEVYDNLILGFIPDYYMTEYYYPGSDKSLKLKENLEKNRGCAAWESVGRAALLMNYSFTATDIQNQEINTTKTLLVFSASYMAAQIQEKLVNHLNEGGNLFLFGEVPLYDMEENPCTILKDALGINSVENINDARHFYLSAYGEGYPETRLQYAQMYDIQRGTPLMRIYGLDGVSAFKTVVGAGKCIVLSGNYNCDLNFFKMCFEYLDSTASLSHDCRHSGIFMSENKNDCGESYIHLLNLDGFNKMFNIYRNGSVLFDGHEVRLNAKDGLLLPLNIQFDHLLINYSTAEVVSVNSDEIKFRLNHKGDVISLTTTKEIAESSDYVVEQQSETNLIRPSRMADLEEPLVIRFI